MKNNHGRSNRIFNAKQRKGRQFKNNNLLLIVMHFVNLVFFQKGHKNKPNFEMALLLLFDYIHYYLFRPMHASKMDVGITLLQQ